MMKISPLRLSALGMGNSSPVNRVNPVNQFQAPVEKIPLPAYNQAAFNAPRMRLADLIGMYRG